MCCSLQDIHIWLTILLLFGPTFTGALLLTSWNIGECFLLSLTVTLVSACAAVVCQFKAVTLLQCIDRNKLYLYVYRSSFSGNPSEHQHGRGCQEALEATGQEGQEASANHFHNCLQDFKQVVWDYICQVAGACGCKGGWTVCISLVPDVAAIVM